MKTGFAIALAWPETNCKNAGSWYDELMELLGFSKNHYYKVGHAAIILINKDTKQCHYFDFGRYHTPLGYGRVRDQETDPDLRLLTRAKISGSGKLENFKPLLNEICNNISSHGTGPTHGSYVSVDFNSAFESAKKLQNKEVLKYGPFLWNGTNCSRFVRTVIMSGQPNLISKLKIAVPFMITPTPLHNVAALGSKAIVTPQEQPQKTNSFKPVTAYSKSA